MDKVERIREVVTGPLDPKYVRQRTEAGWQLVAVEWQRPAEGAEARPAASALEVPYGFRVGQDCTHLEENPAEMDALTLILELIVKDRSLWNMAETLNQQGFRTRDGSKWTIVSVYNMLPHLIEVCPRIFRREAWVERRKQIIAVG